MAEKTELTHAPPSSVAHGVGAAGAGAVGEGVAGAAPPEEKLPRQFGKYMLLRRLAAGGMAEIFLALHRSVAGFEKLVVIKRILPQMNDDQQFIDMLLHEARIAATLSHTNIVQTFDVGQLDGSYFIAMEHIHGEDIRSIVRQMKKVNSPEFPLENALHIVLGLCAGLAYAHDKRDLDGKLLGIVHRDVSPQNLVITFSGDVKIVDFGVAKSIQAHEDASGSMLKGKVPYMSPEQARGLAIDSRSDIFAAGIMLFELTTGRRLFKGADQLDTIRLICDTVYPRPTELVPGYPAELDRIVMKALAKPLAERYQSAREMQADLEAFIRNERLAVSSSTTSAWMQSLFAESLAQQNETLQEIKQLADKLAAELPPLDYNASATGVYARVDLSGSGATVGGATTTPAPEPKSRAGLVLGGVAAVAAIAALAVGLGKKPPPVEPRASANAATAAPAPVEERASLRIESTPPGAAIWISGDLRKETTPATIDNLPVGSEIAVKLSLEGFESHRSKITLAQGGEAQKIDAKLQTGSVSVELDVTPEASVWVDGKPWKGDKKKITGLSADEEHKVMATAVGYAPKTWTFTSKQGETKSFKETLRKLTPAELEAMTKEPSKGPATTPTTISAPPAEEPKPQASGPATVRVNAKGGYCNVSINGQPYGPTPVSATVTSGTVRVSCKPESGPTQQQAVKVDAGQTARVSFSVGG
jgi:serine/threonine-protein kinase